MRNFVGFIIILFGIGLFLEASGISGFDTVANYFWPLIIMAVGVNALRSNPRAWTGPLIIILIGAIMLFDNLHVFPNSAWNIFWPVVIIFIGLQIVLGKWSGPKTKAVTGQTNAFAAFSAVEEKATGAFDGGTASAWFGGIKLDLREADIKDGAVIQVWAAFSGLEVLVPKSVRVATSVMPLFGGAENKSTPDATATKTLHINGTALFGGVGVKN